MSAPSKLVKYDGTWPGISVRPYKEESARHRGITRRELIGTEPDEQALGFVMRYFEIAPGGYSSLERHEHAHAVMVVRGSGTVVLGDLTSQVAAFDCVYVAPGTLHQFQASDHESLGFLCIVDRVRDRPQMPSRAEIEKLRELGLKVKPPELDEE